MNENYAVIMAGGVGSRFWPLSTSSKPKQFLDVLGTGKTLIQLTFDRINQFCPSENIFVVTSQEYSALVKEQLSAIPSQNILSEPGRKNTAPCVAFSCYKIYKANPNAKILIAPSDHLILKEQEYVAKIENGFKAAEQDILITLGIKTTRPDTGYGYIESSDESLVGFQGIQKVTEFREKPALEIAVKYHENEKYFWNSGMFIWSAKSIVKAFEEHCPTIHQIFINGLESLNTENEKTFIGAAYQNVESISIDYAIMEKATNVYMQPCDIGWTDLGTWGSLKTTLNPNENENAILGKNIKIFNSEGNMICNETEQLMVVEGLKGHILVNTEKALLICKLENEQEIKTMVNEVVKDDQYKNLI